LLAAVGSFLQARHAGGEWLVRIEDLDPPREVPGASDAILRALEAHGLYWDDAVVYQSQRGAIYEHALELLRRHRVTYMCGCSRKDIAKVIDAGARIYPGTCRNGLPPGKRPRATRVLVQEQDIAFEDRLQGRVVQNLSLQVGDFVVRRADQLFAYHLAVVVDDAEQGVTEVVRGSDLLLSTPRQIYLQSLLKLSMPDYVHLPVIVNRQGQKLSKQTHAQSIDIDNPVPRLFRVLQMLGQEPVAELIEADLEAFWGWAIRNWRLERVPPVGSIPMPE
jgi:glutamyl-Q tRNA(Asp) synthetase